jgi:hypothetical protein
VLIIRNYNEQKVTNATIRPFKTIRFNCQIYKGKDRKYLLLAEAVAMFQRSFLTLGHSSMSLILFYFGNVIFLSFGIFTPPLPFNLPGKPLLLNLLRLLTLLLTTHGIL